MAGNSFPKAWLCSEFDRLSPLLCSQTERTFQFKMFKKKEKKKKVRLKARFHDDFCGDFSHSDACD